MQKLKSLAKRLLGVQPLRYLISSCTAFAADYTLFLAFDRLLSGASFLSMEIAAVIAFAVSSQINFWINRRWVFHSNKPPLPEICGYYSLALVSFGIKTFVLLEIAVRLLLIPKAIAKPLAEAIMFAFNFLVQKRYIFRRKK